MHPLLVNRLFFPMQERLKGKRTHAKLRELERTQWLEPAALRELQFRRLRAHLEFAYREVAYYRRLLDEHELPPRRIGSLEDFARVPPLTKEIIRTRFDDLRPRTELRGVQRMSTGGSTGAPVSVLVDRERSAFTDATRLRAHRWFGVDMGVREVVVWGSPIELGRQDRIRAARDWVLNSKLLSAFDLGEESLAEYARVVRSVRPMKMFGYASALALLAGYMGREGWRAPAEWPRAVFTTAEPLYEFQRTVIGSTFGCPVAVEYGSRDGGLIANECPAGGLHIAAEGILVEAGEDGELLVTNLESFAMPIIRYRTGDIGSLDAGGCSCGRGLPLLGTVEGRRTDFLVLPDGRIMHALAVIYILREIAGVKEFQVLQERLEGITVTVVPDAGFDAQTQEDTASRLRRLLGAGVEVEFRLVESIPRPSGKHRYVISRVADARIGALLAG
jgi:phenylacetate-coenzyme A ligase PaaK-like adenylate-forming protein